MKDLYQTLRETLLEADVNAICRASHPTNTPLCILTFCSGRTQNPAQHLCAHFPSRARSLRVGTFDTFTPSSCVSLFLFRTSGQLCFLTLLIVSCLVEAGSARIFSNGCPVGTIVAVGWSCCPFWLFVSILLVGQQLSRSLPVPRKNLLGRHCSSLILSLTTTLRPVRPHGERFRLFANISAQRLAN